MISVKTKFKNYNIIIKKGELKNAKEYFNLNRKVLIVTDSGVPEKYSKTILDQCKQGLILTIPQGEESKNIDNYILILKTLTTNNFTRKDCIVAVGGGVVGDISGFSAASYMRGIDFYNVPTTFLSMVDSSIGGKTAIDFCGYKNIVGAFWQPSAVLIDTEVLSTLPKRQIICGMVESIKMSLTHNEELFNIFLNNEQFKEEKTEEIIYKSLLIKKAVVEKDEFENGERKVLNFGHTIAHAIESAESFNELYHGECVAIGMIPMCGEEVKPKLLKVLEHLNLLNNISINKSQLKEAVKHDKKAYGNKISIVKVNKIGTYEIEETDIKNIENLLEEAF